MCNRVPDVEWSGVLFYSAEGTWDKGFTIICKDIFLMDIGSSTYTEFDVNPSVVEYMCSNYELTDYHMGLIHSHNRMATFFSNTDTNTLQEEGNKRNHFVSLIVNNEGTYTAAITRKVVNKDKVKREYSFGTFNGKTMKGTDDYEAESLVIEWYYLNIVKDSKPLFEDIALANRYDEIMREKKEKREKTITLHNTAVDQHLPFDRTLDTEVYNFRTNDTLEVDNPTTSDSFISDSLVNETVKQLITGCVVLPEGNKIDPMKWAYSMEKIFDRRYKDNMQEFDLWADLFCEYLLYNQDIPEGVFDEDFVFEFANKIHEKLLKLPSNKYIESLIHCITQWTL